YPQPHLPMPAPPDDNARPRSSEFGEVDELPTLDGQAPTQRPRTPPGATPRPGSGAHASNAIFSPGQVVAGRYEIVRFIAEGGMGEVYAARDQKLGGTLALKTIRSEAARKAQALHRFPR